MLDNPYGPHDYWSTPAKHRNTTRNRHPAHKTSSDDRLPTTAKTSPKGNPQRPLMRS
ncbi:unnamed protein product, partial [Gadus morhua 'NCC']